MESSRGGRMACFFDTLASVAAPLLGDFLCFCSLAASHPLHLAYFLFFSPYLLAAISFLGPLLLSTCVLLLALLTVSPYLRGAPPPPIDVPSPMPATPGLFCNTLRLVLHMLDPCAEGEPGDVSPPGAFSAIASELQACVDFVAKMYMERGETMPGASPGRGLGDERAEEKEEEEEEEEKRIVAEATIPSSELFGWELEAISKLYKALTYEVEEFPIKLALRSFKEGGLLPPGIRFQGGDREPRQDPPRKEAPCPEFESRDGCNAPTCEDGGDVDIPLGNASNPAIKSRDCGLPGALSAEPAAEAADGSTVDRTSSPPKRATLKSKVVPRSDSDGSRSGKLLRRSSSSSSVPRVAGGGLARVASAGDRRGRGSERAAPEGLSSSASMRKEKEWRRTLACKLYEERMVAEGCEEGMDLLWEAYELGSRKDVGGSGCMSSDSEEKTGKESKAKVAKRGEKVGGGREEEEEEEEMAGRLCCLQVLKFSTAKMSFGTGRSGLLKVSKAMKGVGFFRRAIRSSRRKGGEDS